MTKISDLIKRYDDLVDSNFVGMRPECEGDVLYIVDVRSEIEELIALEKPTDLEANILSNADKRLRRIALDPNAQGIVFPDAIRDKNWWTNLDRP